MPEDEINNPDDMQEAPHRSARGRHEALHREIRERISLHDYPPGMRLSEAELAREFGISRTPLRRVLARLEDEGLVRSVHGVGTFVTDVDIGELDQVYRLRLELAELAGRLDPVAPDEAFATRLDGLILRGREMTENGTPRAFARLDMEVFHLLLELTANDPLRECSVRLYYQTKRIWLKSARAARLDLKAEFLVFLREIEDIRHAVEVNDLGAVAHIRRAHLSMSFQRLLARQS